MPIEDTDYNPEWDLQALDTAEQIKEDPIRLGAALEEINNSERRLQQMKKRLTPKTKTRIDGASSNSKMGPK